MRAAVIEPGSRAELLTRSQRHAQVRTIYSKEREARDGKGSAARNVVESSPNRCRTRGFRGHQARAADTCNVRISSRPCRRGRNIARGAIREISRSRKLLGES